MFLVFVIVYFPSNSFIFFRSFSFMKKYGLKEIIATKDSPFSSFPNRLMYVFSSITFCVEYTIKPFIGCFFIVSKV